MCWSAEVSLQSFLIGCGAILFAFFAAAVLTVALSSWFPSNAATGANDSFSPTVVVAASSTTVAVGAAAAAAAAFFAFYLFDADLTVALSSWFSSDAATVAASSTTVDVGAAAPGTASEIVDGVVVGTADLTTGAV